MSPGAPWCPDHTQCHMSPTGQCATCNPFAHCTPSSLGAGRFALNSQRSCRKCNRPFVWQFQIRTLYYTCSTHWYATVLFYLTGRRCPPQGGHPSFCTHCCSRCRDCCIGLPYRFAHVSHQSAGLFRPCEPLRCSLLVRLLLKSPSQQPPLLASAPPRPSQAQAGIVEVDK